MRFLRLIALSAILAIAAIAQTDHPTITVKELPPEGRVAHIKVESLTRVAFDRWD